MAALRAQGEKKIKAKQSDAASEDAAGAKIPAARPLRPAQCRMYMRRTLAREFEGIVNGFVKQAKRGSCQHVKLATDLLDPKPRAPKPKTGRATVARWLQEVKQAK